jgi:multisubunit Na+/H+ antiporter MnhB subunit
MYSIFIALIFFAIGIWLMIVESSKAPNARNVWSLLAAILSLVMGTAVMLVWLIAVFL